MNHPLTIDYGKRVLELSTIVKVSNFYDETRQPNQPHPKYESCKAIWDTGAMSTTISPALAQKLGLQSLGKVEMHHANGHAIVNTYAINLLLPNKMEIHTLHVMEGGMTDVDVLIGMDVITLCDFAITNKSGKTLFSFDIPSCHETDYTSPSIT